MFIHQVVRTGLIVVMATVSLHAVVIPDSGRAWQAAPRPRVALVLSGGGARGIAHIGALYALEKADIPVDLIVGTSIGAVIGGVYAAGYTADEMERIGRGFDWESIYSDTPERRDRFISRNRAEEGTFFNLELDGLKPVVPTGFSRGQHLSGALNDLFIRAPYQPVRDFNDLKIPFRAVSTDLVTGKRVVLDRGEISEVLRASMAVPLFFTPVAMQGMQLADGGLVDCIPTDVAREAGADIVIAVNLSGLMRTADQIREPLGIADQVLSIMKTIPNSLRLRDADVVIAPPVASFLPADFSNFDALVAAGRAATDAAIPRIRSLIDSLTPTADTAPEDGGMRIAHITFTGNTVYPGPVLRQAAALPVSGRAGALQAAFERVRRIYLKDGYTAVRVRAESSTGGGDTLTAGVREGIICRISVRGNAFTARHVVTRELPLVPGMLFNADQARRGVDNIFATGLFDQVRVGLVYHPDSVEVVVTVREKQPISLSGGFRYDPDAQAAGQLALVHHNLFGLAYGLSLRHLQGKFRNRTGLQVRADRILHTYFSAETELYYQYRELAVAAGNDVVRSTQRWGAAMYMGTQIRRFGNASLGVFWHRQLDVHDGAAADRYTTDEIKGIRLRSLTDSFDRSFYPNAGNRKSFILEAGQSLNAPDRLYVTARYGYAGALGFGNRVTLQSRLDLGAADANTPFTEKLFAGGIASDGYRYRFIGYRPDELWGRNMLLTGTDLRITLFENIYCVLRLAGGYISNEVDFIGREVVFDWEEFRTTFTSSLYFGAGGALAVGTPLGPVELWYGYGDRSRDGKGRVYLNMGYDF